MPNLRWRIDLRRGLPAIANAAVIEAARDEWREAPAVVLAVSGAVVIATAVLAAGLGRPLVGIALVSFVVGWLQYGSG